MDARPDPSLRRSPTTRGQGARSQRLHPYNRTTVRLWRTMPEDAVRHEPPLPRDGALQCRSRARHPRTRGAHRPARRHRPRQPPPTRYASHLPRLRRWNQSAGVSCLPRRQAGEVARAFLRARRRGQPQLARPAAHFSSFQERQKPAHLARLARETAPAHPRHTAISNSSRSKSPSSSVTAASPLRVGRAWRAIASNSVSRTIGLAT